MPKYMYADSTEFGLQRDFIDILERFSDAAIEAIPDQREILELKEKIANKESEKESTLTRIDKYGQEIDSSIEDVTRRFGAEEFGPVLERMKAAASEYVNDFRQARLEAFEKEMSSLKDSLSKKQASLLQVLQDFLYHDPLKMERLVVEASLDGERYDSRAETSCQNGVFYVFKLDFFDRKMEVKDLIEKKVEIPAAMKKTIMGKEKKPRFISLDDWCIEDLRYESNGETVLRATLTGEPGKEDSPKLQLTLTPGEERVESVVYTDEDGDSLDILKDPELRKHVDENLEEYAKFLLGHCFTLTNRKKDMVDVQMDDQGLVENDLAEKFMVRCAKEYAPTVAKIREKGLVDKELNLKVEDVEGRRTELYMDIEEYRSKMKAIPRGSEMCSIMGL